VIFSSHVQVEAIRDCIVLCRRRRMCGWSLS